MNTKYIVFDKDGTLMDFEKFWVKILKISIEAILKKYNAPLYLTQDICKAYGADGDVVDINGIFCGGTYEMMGKAIYDIFEKNGIKTNYDELCTATKNEFYSNYSLGEIVPACDDIEGLFEKISSLGIKAVLVTSDDEFGAKKCLDKFKITKYFDEIYADDGINPPKPHPYYINRLISEKGAKKEEIVMVGDTLTDMNFAKNAGVKAIGVAKSIENKNILMPHADAVLDDISQILEVID